jgi:DNA polymerase III alpha subunit (gram-positive type)
VGSKPEIYVSTDVETDGPIPGPNSMLALASAAFTPAGELVGSFTANLEELPGASGDPKTMAWWKTEPAAWEACRTGARPAADVMPEYAAWIAGLPGRPVFVAYPAGFDFTFVYWYLVRFTGESPFSHSALDMKTLAMALLGTPYRDSTKRAFPARWRSDRPHTHVALDDALEQGEVFCKMLRELPPRGSR